MTTDRPLSRTLDVDLVALASAFGQRLHEADVAVTPRQSEQYVRSRHVPALHAAGA